MQKRSSQELKEALLKNCEIEMGGQGLLLLIRLSYSHDDLTARHCHFGGFHAIKRCSFYHSLYLNVLWPDHLYPLSKILIPLTSGGLEHPKMFFSKVITV